MGFPNCRQILHHLSHQGNPERKVSNDRRYIGGDQEFIMESSLQGKSRGQKFGFGELRPHSWRAAQAPHNYRKLTCSREDPEQPKINTQINAIKKKTNKKW